MIHYVRCTDCTERIKKDNGFTMDEIWTCKLQSTDWLYKTYIIGNNLKFVRPLFISFASKTRKLKIRQLVHVNDMQTATVDLYHGFNSLSSIKKIKYECILTNH